MLSRVFFIIARASLCSLAAATLCLVTAFGLLRPNNAFALKAPEAVAASSDIKMASLPSEAKATIVLIRNGGPFPYPKDGVVFGNRERNLPKQARGFYTEYTVKTPGERSRGARRIVVGGDPRSSTEFYYSDDHYQTFKRIRE
jgi:ribonuclease T1